MVNKQDIFGIDTVELTNNLWVLCSRFTAYKYWPEGFELFHHYYITITLKSKDPYLTEDKEYTGKDAERMLKKEYLDSAAEHIGKKLECQMKLLDKLHLIADWKNNNGSTTENT